jgi:hypothetical protein
MHKLKAFAIVTLVAALFLGCVDAKSRFETDVQNKMGVVNDKLEKVLDVKTDLKNIAQKVDTVQQTVKNQVADQIELMHKTVQAGEIHYGGAGWAVLSAGVMVLLFLGAAVLAIYVLFRRFTSLKSMLHLVTDAVQNAPAEVQTTVKAKIEERVDAEETPFTEQHKAALARFARRMGTFAVGALADRK